MTVHSLPSPLSTVQLGQEQEEHEILDTKQTRSRTGGRTRNNTMNMARAIDMGRYLVVGEPPLNQEGVQHHFGDALCCGGSLTTNREGEVRQAGAGARTVWHNCTIEKHNCKIVQTRWSRWSG